MVGTLAHSGPSTQFFQNVCCMPRPCLHNAAVVLFSFFLIKPVLRQYFGLLFHQVLFGLSQIVVWYLLVVNACLASDALPTLVCL